MCSFRCRIRIRFGHYFVIYDGTSVITGGRPYNYRLTFAHPPKPLYISEYFCVLKEQIQSFIQNVKLFYQKWHLNHLVPIPYMLVYMIVGGCLFWWSEIRAEFERLEGS